VEIAKLEKQMTSEQKKHDEQLKQERERLQEIKANEQVMRNKYQKQLEKITKIEEEKLKTTNTYLNNLHGN